MSRRDRRRLERRLTKRWQRLVAAGVAGLALLLAAPAASAAEIPHSSTSSQFPGTDCKEEPDPEFPGAGVVGDLDPPSENQGKPGGVYHELGYSGQVWHTYDLGCGPDAAINPQAVTDTWVGNLFFNAAKLVVSATIAVNNTIISGGVLDSLDNLLVAGTAALYNEVYVPLVGLALLILGAFCLTLAMKGQLATLSKKTMWALAGLAVASATYLTPILYTQMIDHALTGAMSQMRAGLLSEANVDARYGLSETLHDQVVWSSWLAGEFGSANGAPAQQLGRDLARAQSFTNDEVKAGKTTKADADAKKAQFEQISSRLSPEAYAYFTGKAGSRVGSGAFALAKAVIYGSFQLTSSAVTFTCLLLIRVLVLLAPVLGLIAILRGQTLAETFRAGGAALWQALYLTAISTLHLIALVMISALGLPGIGALLLMSTITVVLWWIAGPWRRLRSMVTAAAGVVGVNVPPAGPRKVDLGLEELWEKLRSQLGIESGGAAPSVRRSEGLSEPDSAPSRAVPAPEPVRPVERPSVPVPASPAPVSAPEPIEKPAVVDELAAYRARRAAAAVYVPSRDTEEE